MGTIRGGQALIVEKSLCLKLSNSDIFESDGTVSYGHEIFVKAGRFDAPCPLADVADYSSEFSGLNVLPGAIDCQVNGSGAILFENVADFSELRALDHNLLSSGTTRWCGSFISAPCNKIERVLRVVEDCAEPTGLIGVHFEGPWINPDYRGCHPPERITRSSPAHIDLLEHATKVVQKVIVTIAPEIISDADLARIQQLPSILICVGHSDARPETIAEKIGSRLRGLTHAFNCMPAMSARMSGPFGIMMDRDDCWSSVICDGEHICSETFHIVKRSSNSEKVFIVSDRMPVDAAVAGTLPFGTETLVFDGTVLRTAAGQLAGSTRSIVDCMRVAISRFSVPADEAIRMGTEYPAKFLGVDSQYGTLEVGRHADLIVADNALSVRAVFRDGVRLV